MEVVPGALYTVKDELVQIPETRAGQQREKHPFRVVLVLSNEWICETAKTNPIVCIAPLSHKTKIIAHTDVEIKKSDKNGLDHDSRVMLGHIQPILREELEKKIGTLSENDLDKVKTKLVFIFSLDS